MSEYLSAADAARHLGCSESLIRSRISSGTLTAKKVLGKWQIRMDDLERQPRAHEGSPPDLIIAEPHDVYGVVAQRRDPATSHDRNAVDVTPAWRDDLLAQVARLEVDAAQR
ncbi:MAG: helix-turn-helix domain-containing protein, partial [Candidatus Poribacteria bacterium]